MPNSRGAAGRQGQADPGDRVRSDRERRAIGRYRRARIPAEQERVSLAESEINEVCVRQPPVPLRPLEARIEQAASGDRVDLPGVIFDPGARECSATKRLAVTIGRRQPGDPYFIERRVPELPGEPVVEGDVPGDLDRLGRHGRGFQEVSPLPKQA